MVLADPVFEERDERVKLVMVGDGKRASEQPAANAERLLLHKSAGESGASDGEFRIPRLPGTRREAEGILALAPAERRKEALDFAASRATATGAELSQHRLIHFATHGFLNSAHPELSGLVLSMVDEQGKPQEGFLRAHEIFNLHLPAELVVLSACQTGLGKEIRGEGLVGLTRGFMYAGAPRVVVSLWNVSDQATAELMIRFYRGMLVEKLRPAAALRKAQIALWKEGRWQAPYYWAAFALQGEWK
jgi:CHAT domain-containing protein